jgi:formate dehydrogenase maturation protein FdhE
MTYYICGVCGTIWNDSHDKRCDCSHCGSTNQIDAEIANKLGIVKSQ